MIMKEEVIEERSLQLVVNEQTLGTLTTNAAQIRDAVRNAVSQYKTENYSEDNVDDAKADKAKLNKAKKSLNDERIRLEKVFMAPFEEFKAIVKETVGYIDEAVSNIDVVIKEVDQKAKDEKRTAVEKIAEYCGLEEVGIHLSKIWNDKWLNKSTSMKAIETEISSKVEAIKRDIETLKSFSEDSDALIVRYKENLDFNATIAYANQLKAQRDAKKADEHPKEQPKPEEKKPEEAPKPVNTTEPLMTRGLKITATRSQIIEIAEFLNRIGVKYESIKV